MKNFTFNTPSNYTPSKGKKFTTPSLTIPNKTLSVKEIFIKYAKGGDLSSLSQRQAYYDERSSGINPATLDLAEREEIIDKAKSVKTEIEELNESKNNIAKAAKAAEKATLEAEIETLKAQKEKTAE